MIDLNRRIHGVTHSGLVDTRSDITLLARGRDAAANDERYRVGLGRVLLLGLEFLVAADIIRTVAIAPTFQMDLERRIMGDAIYNIPRRINSRGR
ncbi:MAG: DUF1622 domain-containing protein [Chloroflexota bacterium]|nr:DUF1622 domain-containing protein [Chloroflexota bacterium]